MNLVYGEVVDLETEEGMKIGSVRVSGVLTKVPLHLVPGARRGDKVLLCDGVAIAKVDPIHESPITTCENYVSRHSG